MCISRDGWIPRVLGAAAVVGLLTLQPAAAADSGEDTASGAIDLLLDRHPLGADERLAEAERLLHRERTRRAAGLLDAVGDTAWRGLSGGSLGSLLKGVRDVAHQASGILGRSEAESSALALLEPAVASGESDPRMVELYRRLRARERREQSDAALDEVERALEVGELRRAERRLARARELRPDDRRVASLGVQIAERRAVRFADRSAGERFAPLGPSDARVAAALLAGEYERAAALAETALDPELVRGAALLLGGHREAGVESLRAAAEGNGRVADVAERWLANPDIDPASALRLERRRYRVRRALGFLGGNALEMHGLDLSGQGVRSWGESLTPMNLALSVPVRVARGRRADGSGLRTAALRYLEVAPDGAQADEARAWLARLEPSARERARRAAWDDGRFVLQPADTPYEPVVAGSLVISRAALAQALPSFDLSREQLVGARAIALVPRRVLDPELALELPADEARALVPGLVEELEAGRLRDVGGDRAAALAGLRRVQHSVRRGTPLFAESRSPSGTPVVSALRTALLENGRQETRDGLWFRRRRSGLEARSEFSASLTCPPRTVCLERARRVMASGYARFEADGDLKLGAQTRVNGASLALEVTESGPRGALRLPIGAWLGLARWVPVSAEFAFSLEGVSFRPAFGRPGG